MLGRSPDTIRSMISRAYYAAYSMVTHRLREAGQKTFGRRGNPSHDKLPKLARHNLTQLSRVARRDLSQAIRRLRDRRVIADYLPMHALDSIVGRDAFRDLVMIERLLEFHNEN
jgi:hypothetical protein